MSNRQGVWSLSAHLQAIGDTNWLMPPGVPTSVSATAGNTQATVAFTAPTFAGVPGTITGFKVTSSEGETATGSSSPITVTGLTNGTAYTFTVQAQNSTGFGGSSSASSSISPALGRGIFGAGSAGSRVNTIDYVSIASTGNATDFGDLTVARQCSPSLMSSSTRCILGSGIEVSVTYATTLDYVTIASTGNATDFGDLTVGRYGQAGCSNSTRAVTFNGDQQSGTDNTIDYVTIASTGNATDFGDTQTTPRNHGGVASPTRGLRCGGNESNVIEYITIGTTGNSTDFGDLTVYRYSPACAGSNTRACIAGGEGGSDNQKLNIIDYVTIASTGNATDFGDMTETLQGAGGTSNSTRAVYGGGETSSTNRNNIDYITIASTGNAQDFGDLTQGRRATTCGGDSHGGIS